MREKRNCVDDNMIYDIESLGDICPIPLMKAKKKFLEMDIGDCIKLVTDHSCVYSSLTDYFNHYTNCRLNVSEVMNGIWEIELTKILVSN